MPTALNRESRPSEKEMLPANTFIIVRGMPGSGKSTLLEAAQAHYAFELIDPDITYEQPNEFEAYVRSVSKENKDFEKLNIDTLMYRFHIQKSVEALKSGKAVVWAQPW